MKISSKFPGVVPDFALALAGLLMLTFATLAPPARAECFRRNYVCPTGGNVSMTNCGYGCSCGSNSCCYYEFIECVPLNATDYSSICGGCPCNPNCESGI